MERLSLFPHYDYVQAYETTAHLISKHNEYYSLFSYVLGLEDIEIKEEIKGEQMINQLTRYIEGIKFAADLRIEVVLSGTRWAQINEQHMQFAPDVEGSIGNFVSCLVREKCIVRMTNWREYVECTSEKLLKALKYACSPEMHCLNRSRLNEIYLNEQLLLKWIEDNSLRFDTAIVTMLKWPAEKSYGLVRKTDFQNSHAALEKLNVKRNYKVNFSKSNKLFNRSTYVFF